jgi:plastocyanin
MNDERDGDDASRHVRDGDGTATGAGWGDDHDRESRVDRRTLLGSVGVAVAVATAGCFANETGGDGTTAADGENVVAVGPNGSYAYEPAEITVSVGDTVTWNWDSRNHNIVVSEQPDDASWSGTEGDAATAYDAPHTYEYTFDAPGTYEYYCQPHEGLGMAGTVVVEA